MLLYKSKSNVRTITIWRDVVFSTAIHVSFSCAKRLQKKEIDIFALELTGKEDKYLFNYCDRKRGTITTDILCQGPIN